MKIIKTIILLILLFVSSFAFGQIVNIPDVNFKTALTTCFCADTNGDGLPEEIVDSNGDGEIQFTEAIAVSWLNVESQNPIQSIEGIQFFTSLTRLDISGHQLTNLDLSNNFNLTTLYCSNNQLTNLDLSSNFNLTFLLCDNNLITTLNLGNSNSLINLSCIGNELTSLDLNSKTNLDVLSCSNNQISNLDLSQNINLNQLYCQDNQLTSLNLLYNTGLSNLNCSNNQISSIDLTQNTSLYGTLGGLRLSGNLLTTIDVSQNPNLSSLYCDDNPLLTSINLKNGNTSIGTQFSSLNNPNLAFVCANNDNVDDLNAYFTTQGMAVNVNTYCSFVPGGDYNIITGNITYDSDNNGCNANNNSFPFNKININDGTDTSSTFTTNSGEYNFYPQDGTFTMTPNIENPSFFNATPVEATINFPNTNNNLVTQDFCITANGVHNDVEIVVAPTIPARPGFDAQYIITYKNKGNQTLSGDFSFNYDDSVLDYVSATETPTTQTTGQLTWDYVDLLPFENRSIYLTLNVNSPQETPAINIDDVLDFTVLINPIAGDQLPDDNTFNYKQTVVGAYDPNNIKCLEGDILEPTEIGEYLHYIINFENTGNFTAQNIVVATEIDPTMFDVSTLRVLSSSHDAYVKQKGNLIEIVFESIYLASGGHGNILLKVQSQDVLVEDDTVTKKANIFFDYNFPIQTNNANTTYQQLLSTTEYEIDQNVTIYPNPVKNWVTISSKENIKSVSVFDVQGRVLQTQIGNSKEIKLDLANRNNGVYFIKIQTEKGINVEKVIKQ